MSVDFRYSRSRGETGVGYRLSADASEPQLARPAKQGGLEGASRTPQHKETRMKITRRSFLQGTAALALAPAPALAQGKPVKSCSL